MRAPWTCGERLAKRPITALLVGTLAVASGCGKGDTAPVDAAVTTDVDTGMPDLMGGVHSSCPTTLAGPDLVRVGWSGGVAFCIDSTEVTNAQYQKFLAATPPAPSPRCQWNTSLAPSTTAPGCQATFDPVGRADYPVVCVDWCDAEAYCRWAGKHLCRAGSLDGADPGPVTHPLAADGSEWIIACSNDHATTYPYANEPEAGRCVDKKYLGTAPGLQPAKAASMCVGGIAGLYDMAGNASEWQNNCVEAKTSVDGKDDACDTYGGAQSSEYVDTSCTAATAATDTAAHFTRGQVAADNGFRCCADAMFF
jgi:formylglycine-generating enzyme required for sulfatase activity